MIPFHPLFVRLHFVLPQRHMSVGQPILAGWATTHGRLSLTQCPRATRQLGITYHSLTYNDGIEVLQENETKTTKSIFVWDLEVDDKFRFGMHAKAHTKRCNKKLKEMKRGLTRGH